MQLSLKHTSTTHASPAAAYLPGTDVELWLLEMARWKLPWKDLQCFPVPVSLEDNRQAGLLVIFPENTTAQTSDFPNPYIRIGKRLLIPQHTKLFPPLLPEELNSLSSWEVQFLHPTIGLVGFDEKDAIALEDVLRLKMAIEKDWSKARQASPVAPRLRSISIEEVSIENVFSEIHDSLNTKSLKDIPSADDEDESLLDTIGYNILKGSSSLLEGFMDRFGKEMTPEEAASGETPPLNQLHSWMQGKMDDILNRREKELERLEKLFDEDPDEALRYAIPLDSPYAGRGTSTPSSQLGKNNTDFSLGGIGGGGASDAWKIHNERYFALQRKYTESANRAIQEGDFRKAAYIYARLLGNLNQAANVLEQGGHYREAAALFKDHLKNKHGASRCLEAGGMLGEAAVLYEEIDNFEKAADLFGEIGNTTKSSLLYQKAASKAIDNNNPLKAGKLYAEKLHDSENAQHLWFDQGWKKGTQADECLNAWLDSVSEGDGETAIKKLDQVFRNDTPGHMEPTFGKVLLGQKKALENEEIDAYAEQVAYEVISRNLQRETKGTSLHIWKRMLPNDRLLGQDLSRFTLKKKKPLPPLEDVKEVTRVHVNDTYWTTSFVCLGQLFLVGVHTKNKQLILAVVKQDGMHGFLMHSLPQDFNPGDKKIPIAVFPDLEETGDVMLIIPILFLGDSKWVHDVGDKKLRFFFPSNTSISTIGISQQGISRYINMDSSGTKESMYKHSGKELIGQAVLKNPFVTKPRFPNAYPVIQHNKATYLITNSSFQQLDRHSNEFVHLATLNPESSELHWNTNPYNLNSDWVIWAEDGFRVVRFQDDGFCISEPFLNPMNDNFKPKRMAIIPVNKLVLASLQRIQIYDLSEEAPSLIRSYTTEDKILNIHISEERNKVYVVLENGKVFQYRCV